MFYFIELDHDVLLHSQFFDKDIKQHVKNILLQEVENQKLPRYGWCVMVTNIKSIDKGRIQEGTGMVTFKVSYQAVIYRPIEDEVIDATVGLVNQHGVWIDVGPIRCIVSKLHLPPEFVYDPHGSAGQPCYKSEKSEGGMEVITTGTDVRVRMFGTRVTDFSAVCTMKEEYLGIYKT
eukprot:Clim_evm40s241 gene=Clim_evmTU40s241